MTIKELLFILDLYDIPQDAEIRICGSWGHYEENACTVLYSKKNNVVCIMDERHDVDIDYIYTEIKDYEVIEQRKDKEKWRNE